MTGRVLAWGVALLLLATSGLQAATVSGTTAYTLSSVTNVSTKALNYKATQAWATSGIGSCLVCLPIGSPGLAAGDYEVSFDFMTSDPPDALVVSFRGDNAGDGHNWQRTVVNPAKLSTWQHATAVYTVAGADAWTGRLEFYVKFNADTVAGTTDSFLVHLDNIVIRRVSDSAIIKSVNFEGDTAGSAPSPTTLYEDHWVSGDPVLAIDQFLVGYTPTPLVQSDFNTATVKSYINNEVINSGTPTIDDLTARITNGATQVADVVDLGGSNRTLRFTDNDTVVGPRAFKTVSGVSSGSTGSNEVTVMFDVTPLAVTGGRPTLQVSLNTGTSETAGSAVSALHLKFKEAGGLTKLQYYTLDGSEHSNFLTTGFTYRVHIVLNLSNPTSDVQSIRVAPVNDMTHPVMEATDVLARAANVVPGILVFDGGVDGAAVNASPHIQIDNLNVTAAAYARPTPAAIPTNTLWQIGCEDLSSAEFSTTTSLVPISAYTIPSDWQTRQDWTAFTPRPAVDPADHRHHLHTGVRAHQRRGVQLPQ